MSVHFKCDPKKAASNVREHGGVTLTEATEAMGDPYAVEEPDEKVPERVKLTGRSYSHRLLLVVYMEVTRTRIELSISRPDWPLGRKGNAMKKATIKRAVSPVAAKPRLARVPDAPADDVKIQVQSVVYVNREKGPSAAPLRKMPAKKFTKAVRDNPHAARIAREGITYPGPDGKPVHVTPEELIQRRRGRPRLGEERMTITRSVRLPPAVWEALQEKADRAGLPLHAVLRTALLNWLAASDEAPAPRPPAPHQRAKHTGTRRV